MENKKRLSFITFTIYRRTFVFPACAPHPCSRIQKVLVVWARVFITRKPAFSRSFSWVIGQAAHGTRDLQATRRKGNTGMEEKTEFTEACHTLLLFFFLLPSFPSVQPLYLVVHSLISVLSSNTPRSRHICFNIYLFFSDFKLEPPSLPASPLLNFPPHSHSSSCPSSAPPPISRLDLWKRPSNFLEDYSDGFYTISIRSEMWGSEQPLHRRARGMFCRRGRSKEAHRETMRALLTAFPARLFEPLRAAFPFANLSSSVSPVKMMCFSITPRHASAVINKKNRVGERDAGHLTAATLEGR